MNKKIILIVLVILLILIGIILVIKKNKPDNKKQDSDINNQEENKVDTNPNVESENDMKLYIKINNKTLTATLENNSSTESLLEKLKQNDLTIEMEDYANFEKVGALGFNLPRNDKQITTTAGDIILYQGNSITIYYDENSWNFTKLGHIDNIEKEELKEILGDGDVTVTFTLMQ